jgi:hypothetical protein
MSTTKLLVALFVAGLFNLGSSPANAAQRSVVGPDGKTHIVHDELGPVLMHRVFPPYKGIHIHSSELKRMESGRRR